MRLDRNIARSLLVAAIAATPALADTTSSSITYPSSCQEAFGLGTRQNGIYAIEAEGGTLNVLCHFVANGKLEGGWSTVAYQSDPFSRIDWQAGIHPQRLPSAYLAASFALSPDQVPPHEAMALGRIGLDGRIEILDLVGRPYPARDGTLDPDALAWLSLMASRFPGFLLLVR